VTAEPEPIVVVLPRTSIAFLADCVGGTGIDWWGDIAAHYGLPTETVEALWKRLTAALDTEPKPVDVEHLASTCDMIADLISDSGDGSAAPIDGPPGTLGARIDQVEYRITVVQVAGGGQ
jgi:hypothetical protein